MVVLNTIIAESLDYVATELEKAPRDPKNFNAAVQKLLRKMLRENSRIIFNGDNYSKEWLEEAARRGLPSAATTPDALDAMRNEASAQVFEKYGVLSRRELQSRFEIYYDRYVKDIMIEARLCLNISRTMIFPAAVKYQHLLATTASALNGLGMESCTTTLQEVTALLAKMQKSMHLLEDVIHLPEADAHGNCLYLLHNVIPVMGALRASADALEHICSDEYWPLPTYQEMLFIR